MKKLKNINTSEAREILNSMYSGQVGTNFEVLEISRVAMFEIWISRYTRALIEAKDNGIHIDSLRTWILRNYGIGYRQQARVVQFIMAPNTIKVVPSKRYAKEEEVKEIIREPINKDNSKTLNISTVLSTFETSLNIDRLTIQEARLLKARLVKLADKITV